MSDTSIISEMISLAGERFFYLASPYSSPDASVREARVAEVLRFAGAFLASGVFVHTPFGTTHPAAKARSLPLDAAWWARYNRAFLRPSAGLIVCEIDGWAQSQGVDDEMRFAQALAKPIYTARIGTDGLLDVLRVSREVSK